MFADSSMHNDLNKTPDLQMKSDVCCEVTLRHFTVASNGGKTLRKLKQVSELELGIIVDSLLGGMKSCT